MREEEEFTPLQVVKKSLLDANRCNYRIYKTPEEFVTVEAATALEAFRESGIKNPFRIQREIRFMDRQMDETRFDRAEEMVETGGVFMEAPEEIAAHSEPVPNAAPAAEEQEAEAPKAQLAQPEQMVEEQPAAVDDEASAAPDESQEQEADDNLSEEDIDALLNEGNDGE